MVVLTVASVDFVDCPEYLHLLLLLVNPAAGRLEFVLLFVVLLQLLEAHPLLLVFQLVALFGAVVVDGVDLQWRPHVDDLAVGALGTHDLVGQTAPLAVFVRSWVQRQVGFDFFAISVQHFLKHEVLVASDLH